MGDRPKRSGATSGGVVLLHGHRARRGMMWPLAANLRQAGFATLVPGYSSRQQSLGAIVDAIALDIKRFAKALDGPLHFVGHSLGGLVIRSYLKRYPVARLGHVVMLSTPHLGSEWADLIMRLKADRFILGPVGDFLTTRRDSANEQMLGDIDFPLGVIAGDTPLRRFIPNLLPRPNDGTVAVSSTRIDGMADHIVLPVTHAMMPFNRAVARQTLAFIQSGQFAR